MHEVLQGEKGRNTMSGNTGSKKKKRKRKSQIQNVHDIMTY